MRVLSCVVVLTLCVRGRAEPVVLDDFSDLGRWKVVASEGVQASISPSRDGDAPALRLDFDFQAGAGYCIVRRQIAMPLPPDYRFSFRMRAEGAAGGDAPRNNLEFKLIDASGNNVWWINRRALEFPREWTQLRNRARQFSFAWGPSGGARLEQLGSIEFAVSAAEGGKGSVYLSRLAFEPIEEPPGPPPAVMVSASSGLFPAPRELGDGALNWKSKHTDESPWLDLDLGHAREFGGLIIDWDDHDFGTDFDVLGSDDGDEWRTLFSLHAGRGGKNWIPILDGEARRIRLAVKATSRGQGVGISRLALRGPRFSASTNSFLRAVAADRPRGWMPRYWHDEQSYWTIVGVPGASQKAALNTDGALEVAAQGCTIEPMVLVRGGRTPRLATWADVKESQRLERGSLPVPTVTWDDGDFRLETTAFAVGTADASGAVARYRLTNTTEKRLRARLALVVRPYQVLPPWQELNLTGGASPISKLAFDGSAVVVDGVKRIETWTPPAAFGAAGFAQGGVVADLASDLLPAAYEIEDPMRLASGALVYDADLGPGETMTVTIGVPLASEMPLKPGKDEDPATFAEARLAETVSAWERDVNRARLELPDSARKVADTFRTMQAALLVDMDGPAIQPGARTYARSWIRDGSLGCAALVATGHPDEAKAFIDWYAQRQYPSGKIPCVVDRRGPDPVDENDSTGEYIFGVKTVYAFTRDREFLERHLPRIEKGVDYLRALRAKRMTPEYGTGPELKRACYGLVPESISHEGYSAKPMHSYWDSFFTVEGLKDAGWLEEQAGRTEQAASFRAELSSYRRCLYDSVTRATRLRAIDYMPGCVELGDFDATSTAIAVWPCGELNGPLQYRLRRTFERYEDFFTSRKIDADWLNYTPYEIRLVGTFVRLGEPERAQELLDFFLKGQRPAGWNQWAEVVWRDETAPRFIGDMPHTWVGSEYINAIRSMLIQERDDGALVLAAGVPPEWLAGGGLRASDFPTEYGSISLKMRQDGHRLVAELQGPERAPPRGLVLRIPGTQDISRLTLDGKAASLDAQRTITISGKVASIIAEFAGPD